MKYEIRENTTVSALKSSGYTALRLKTEQELFRWQWRGTDELRSLYVNISF